MNLLRSIDIAVFRFINGDLSNPVLDWFMPLFAGHSLFWPVLLVALGGALWKGGQRGRLCVLLLCISLTAGDCWFTNMMKDAVGRPRPCISLENVNLPITRSRTADPNSEYRRGCSETGSFPSGHTTNWFAATMVLSLYYRRLFRYMLPMACVVAFSRIYNGVHYPSDVLGGAILGAGYGFAFVYIINAAWRWLGPRWFPEWFQHLPTLIPQSDHPGQVDDMPSSPRHAASGSTTPDRLWLRLGYLLIALIFLGRLWYLTSGRIELSEDEAYQWLWSRHLALSYFSKPPLIAYAQWLGTKLFGNTELGVRFFSPLLMAIGALVLLRFFARHVNARAGFWLIVCINLTPLIAAGSTLFTVDSLLVFFWTLAMVFGWRAVQPNGRTTHWALTGLCIGLAFLSKYTALLLWLCWLIYFVVSPSARIHLRRPGPYLALLINALCALPVIIWNAQHGWITAAHVASDAGFTKAWNFNPMHLVEFTGAAAVLMHPMFFIATAWACFGLWKRRTPLLVYFFSMGAPVFVVYWLFTLYSRVLPNWIAASVIPLLCVMVIFWERRMRDTGVVPRRTLTVACIIGVAAVTFLHESDGVISALDSASRQFTGKALPVNADPLRRVRGWERMARRVERERLKLEGEGTPTFVIARHYGTASVLSFYMPSARKAGHAAPLVYFRALTRPKNQFYFWPSYKGARRGQNALYVQEKDRPEPVPRDVLASFQSVELLGRFPVQVHGRVVHYVEIFACRNLL